MLTTRGKVNFNQKILSQFRVLPLETESSGIHVLIVELQQISTRSFLRTSSAKWIDLNCYNELSTASIHKKFMLTFARAYRQPDKPTQRLGTGNLQVIAL